jgi:GT2 family glycosyltransferase
MNKNLCTATGNSLCVFITVSHNRPEKTIESLLSLIDSIKISNISAYKVILFDHSDNEDTSNLVKNRSLDVKIVKGSSDLYWSLSMHYAIKHVKLYYSSAKSLVVFNDDVVFNKDAVENLTNSFVFNDNCVLVGTVIDKYTRGVSYGGLIKREGVLGDLSFKHASLGVVTSCDTLNMNMALIPFKIIKKYGNIDPFYFHSLGDVDYGLMLKRNNVRILSLSKHVGFCSRNNIDNTWKDSSLNRFHRLKLMQGRKGLNYKQRYYFYKKNGNFFWFFLSLLPYAYVFLTNGGYHKK